LSHGLAGCPTVGIMFYAEIVTTKQQKQQQHELRSTGRMGNAMWASAKSELGTGVKQAAEYSTE